MNSHAKIRVLCVDDSEDITQMIESCIAAEPDMESAGCLYTADDLVSVMQTRRPDVVLLDLKMPGKDPLAVLRELRALAAVRELTLANNTGREPSVIVLSGRKDQFAVDSAATAGARGYICKNVEIPRMLEAIRAVVRNNVPFGCWL